MNKDQRERLDVIAASIEDIKFEEQEKYDNLPDGFRDGEQGSKLQEGIDALETAIDAIQGIT